MGGGRRNCLTTPGHSFIHVGKSEIRSLSHIVHKNVCVCVCVYVSHSVLSDSMQPHGLWPTRLLCPWDFPGRNTGVVCHFLLQGIFPIQGQNPGLLHCRWSLVLQADSLQTKTQGSPKSPEHTVKLFSYMHKLMRNYCFFLGMSGGDLNTP